MIGHKRTRQYARVAQLLHTEVLVARRRARRSWGAIRKLPSGRFQASYVGDDLVRHNAPRTFTSKLDGEAWLAAERRKLELGEWEPPAKQRARDGLTVSEYTSVWIEQRKLRPRTASGYRALLRNHIEPAIGDRLLIAVTPEVVRRWYAGLGTDYPTRNAHAYQLLHAVMATAVEDNLVPANPVHVRGAMHAERQRTPIILEPAQVQALAEAMPPRLSASILLAAWCALRWGETSELRSKDLDLDHGVLTVARGVTYRDREFVVQGTKSGVVRRVVMPPHICPAVAQHCAQHVPKGDPEALLFPADGRGEHMLDVEYRDVFRVAARQIGVAGLHVHDLRHFGGTQAARVGGTTAEVMNRLGHSTVQAAMRYQARTANRDAEIAAALSELASGS